LLQKRFSSSCGAANGDPVMNTQPKFGDFTSVPEPAANERKQMGHASSHHGEAPYRNLALTGLLHLPIMYAVMFTMVYSMREVVHNLNTLYMAGMMAAPMILLMPMLMGKMYPNKTLNRVIYAAAALLFLLLFSFMRNQTFVGDKQFLRSMIPHHSGAVLMCEKAKLHDAEVLKLCQNIIKGQKAEIEQMKKILGRV
jgi:uncharacterized protein (DUF305 family)